MNPYFINIVWDKSFFIKNSIFVSFTYSPQNSLGEIISSNAYNPYIRGRPRGTNCCKTFYKYFGFVLVKKGSTNACNKLVVKSEDHVFSFNLKFGEKLNKTIVLYEEK